jgi:penicillin-binding protein 2
MLATPLQLAFATSVIASRGLQFKPRLVRAVNDEAMAAQSVGLVEADDAHWQIIHEAMHDVLHGQRGSARAVGRDALYTMAGKSGTAQVIGIAQDAEYNAEELEEWHRDHGLFIAFAPYEHPEIAVAVVVENGGGGSKVAAPIARQVIESYLQRRELASRG